MAATDEVTDEYGTKSELNFNNRLIAGFRIPDTTSFWSDGFKPVPEEALFPKGDLIFEVCEKIRASMTNTFL